MKKLFYSFFAAAAMLTGITSCSQEAVIDDVASDDLVEVTFTTGLEGANESRAIGDGTTAKYLYFGAYLQEKDANNTVTYDYLETLQPTNAPATGKIEFVDKKATVKLRLVKGQTYRFLFWAQSTADESYYAVNFEDAKVSVKYDANNTIAANDEKRDAFYVVKTYTINGPLTETITLKRPFAQVNVGVPMGELAEAVAAGVTVTNSSFTFGEVATTLNVFDGTVGDKKKVTYTSALIPEVIPQNGVNTEGELKNVKKADYEYIAMNYILVNDPSNANDGMGGDEFVTIADADFTMYAGTQAIKTYDVPNLPVQRNWRTNIIGSIMSDAEFNIVIDPIFDGDHNYPENTEVDIKQAAENGGRVVLQNNATITEPLNVTGHLVIDLNGKILTYDAPTGTTDEEKKKNTILFRVQDGGSLTFEGVGAVESEGYIASANTGGKIIVNGNANYTSQSTTTFQANGGEVYIKAGRYEVKSAEYGTKYTLNHIDKSGGLIEVTGGTFINFDPAKNAAENPGMNFVKAGYASFQRTESAGQIYEVRPATGNVKLNAKETVTSWIIPEGETLNLDLSEGSLTVLNNGLINYGTMTVKNGYIFSGTTEDSRRNIYNYGVMTIENVRFEQNYDKKGAAINNEGIMTIKNASVTASAYAIWNSGANAVLTIDGGLYQTITTGTKAGEAFYTVVNQDNAQMTINGGTFEGNHGVIAVNSGVVNLNGGSYVCKGIAGVSDHAIYVNGTLNYHPSCTIDNKDKADGGKDIYITKTGKVYKKATSLGTLVDILNGGDNVTLTTDVTTDATLVMNGGILDGAGYTLSNSTKTYTINTKGGTIKNLTIDSGSRGIYGIDMANDMTIDNVHISGVGYPFNFMANENFVATKKLTVTNSTLIGWTSYTGFVSASFGNCTFGIGNYYNDSNTPEWDGCFKPYVTTTLKNCTFENGFLFNLSALQSGATITLDNCYCGATKVTKENISNYLKIDGDLTKVTFK